MKKVPTIASVTDQETQGKRIYTDIFLIPEDSVDLTTEPEIDEEARTMGALTLKQGEVWSKHQAVKFTPAETNEGQGGDITTDANGNIAYTLGGDRPEIDDFIENQHGRGFFVGTIDRFTGEQKIYGRPRCPYYFQNHSKRKTGENTSCDITMNSPFIFQPLKYLGEFITTVKPGT